MEQKLLKPRGTQDVLPSESWKWHSIEEKMHEIANIYGYKEIRTPTFESTEVFSRGVGGQTDIVSKEMYTFEDKGGRSVTLRPEVTAGAVRAVLENGLLQASGLPLKAYYIQSCFRYERAQKGRLREFHQFGVECYGASEAQTDVEVMSLANSLFEQLGVKDAVSLEINSIGCPECRPNYYRALQDYFREHTASLCKTCMDRLEANPMRILDCKEKKCAEIAHNAPIILDYLCNNCTEHFEQVKQDAWDSELNFIINPRIVRGLDYYTNTVFEFVAQGVGTQGTVCGGGRYNGLIEQMGGSPTPAVGFGMGIERLLMLMDERKCFSHEPAGAALFAVAATEAGRKICLKLACELRRDGISASCGISSKSVKSQMKTAGRLNALYTVVMGDEEAESGIVRLKRMSDGDTTELPLVGLLSIFKFLMQEDPLAKSIEPLEDLVRDAGPVITFGGS